MTSYSIIVPWLGMHNVSGVVNLVVFNLIAMLAVISHFRAMTTDPGSVPNCAIPLTSDAEEFDYEAQDKVKGTKYKKFCKRCNAFKPRRAHHCSVCKRCIIKMDHHCPWLNNCVGIGNHKLFLQFLFWINVMSCYSLVLNITRYVNCVNAGLACGSILDHTMSLLVLLESILFALFTVCMMVDQWSVVSTNQTQIDRMKQMKPESKTVTFNEVFGTDHSVWFRLHFLYPTPVYFPSSMKDEILGYSVPGGREYDDVKNDDTHEMTPLTSIEDWDERDERQPGESSQHRPLGGADLSHIFNSPGGHGASMSDRSYITTTTTVRSSSEIISSSSSSSSAGSSQILSRPLAMYTSNNTSHNTSSNNNSNSNSGLYESKEEEEEEELLAANKQRHSFISSTTSTSSGGVSHSATFNGDNSISKRSIFPSMFPLFSSSTTTSSQLATLSHLHPEPPSSPSKESPHRESQSGTDSSGHTQDTPSSGTSSNQESLMESKSIFMRKRQQHPSAASTG